MSGRHQIKRQVLEIAATDPGEARRLQAVLEQLQRTQIAPLIERLCDELGASEQVQRIETLMIDLGEIDSEEFEASFMATLRRQLKKSLERALRETSEQDDPAVPPACPELEALAIFARTGTLPWWSPTHSPTVLHEGLQALLRDRAPLLTRLLADLIREPQPLVRIVAHFDDAALAAMLDLLHRPHRLVALGPEHGAAAVFTELGELTEASAGLEVLPAHQRRALLWRSLFTISARTSSPSTPAAFFTEVLDEASTRAGIDPAPSHLALERRLHGPSRLLALLHHATRTCIGGQALPRLLDPLHALAANIPAPADPSAWLRTQLARILRDSTPTQTFLALAREDLNAAIAAGLAPPLRDAIAAALRTASPIPDTTDHAPHETRREDIPVSSIAHPTKLSDPQRHDPPTDNAEIDEPTSLATLTDAPALTPPISIPDARPPAPRRPPPPAPRKQPLALDLGFSETDELTIGDAGLIILWPFLGHFFGYLDLLDQHSFRDEPARHRAAQLLRVCASGDPRVPEYQLPLARLLCGLPQARPFDPGAPIHEDEEAECTRLLTAVIARAPILRDMSIEGFRGTFLLRDGLLGQRDGHWLLRVERRAYDLVLDRFPWSFGWVKLPWMDTAIRVEW